MPHVAPKILIIDDEESILISLETALQGQYKVHKAGNGKQALDLLAKKDFSVVLLDVVLPDANGEELLKTIKTTWPATEVIMMTAVKKEIRDAVYCMELGAFDYLIKPMNVAELLRIVRHAADKSGLQNEVQVLRRQLEALGASGAGAEHATADEQSVLRRISELASAIIGQAGSNSSVMGIKKAVQELERQMILRALNAADWNQSRSADRLGLYRNTLVKKMRAFNIPAKRISASK